MALKFGIPKATKKRYVAKISVERTAHHSLEIMGRGWRLPSTCDANYRPRNGEQ
jgi:hypothetical protein